MSIKIIMGSMHNLPVESCDRHVMIGGALTDCF